MKKFSILILFIAASIGSAFAPIGPDITTKKLELPEFHSIYVNSGYTVKLKQTNKQEVEVVALTEIYNISEFKVKDGVLHVNVERKEDNKNKTVWEKIDNIKISPEMTLTITMRDIKSLAVNGSGKIIGENSIASDNLNLSVAGSGTIDVDVKSKTLKTDISGSGEVKLKGYANDNDISISGSGTLHGYDCALTSSKTKISGSGTCEINVTDNLEAKILGSGNLKHKGQTKNVVKTIYGSGSVEREY
ncbi:DUF2807 domain-containing protein [Fulvivirga sp. RKSG066]|uniref:head GIN domain-containing protein n=1 Tax=Fulvivirga aurantia TaxID=2529383 RepID=UPI0012BD5579|nr:head GIN domain-containing protein [Fulvivirga aurantia]MTI20644.1 DUF2807 domain-containing protein [Fulvivirga aurantia]